MKFLEPSAATRRIKVVATPVNGYDKREMSRLLVIICIAFLGSPTTSYAMRFFYEMGGGVSQVRLGSTFFNSLAPSVLSLGTALQFGMGVDFYNPLAQSNIHIGIQERYTSGSSGTTSFSWHAPYVLFRLEASRLLISAGAAPLIWKRIATTAGIDSFIRSTSSIGVLGEVGYQAPITPEVSLAVLASTQSISTNSTWSPKPSIELIALLRFFMGGKTVFEKSRGYYGEGGMGEYDGYRYPYGWEIKR